MVVSSSLHRYLLVLLLTSTSPLAPTAAAALAVRDADAAVVGVPAPLPHLTAAPDLLALVARMVRRSPTFARLCARLGQARNLYVRMRVDGPAPHGRYVARSVIRRHEHGALIVEVVLHAPNDMVELIAHEFEHILEQVERVDLATLSRMGDDGVARLWNGDFETRRAVQAGRRVAVEYGAAVDDTDAPAPEAY